MASVAWNSRFTEILASVRYNNQHDEATINPKSKSSRQQPEAKEASEALALELTIYIPENSQ